MTTASMEWALWSTAARLVVTVPSALAPARELVDAYLQQVDDAANRFRDDSEIRNLVRDRNEFVDLSPVLTDLVGEALAAADFTGGDVDPTVGTALRRLGYDRDLSGRPGLLTSPGRDPSCPGLATAAPGGVAAAAP